MRRVSNHRNGWASEAAGSIHRHVKWFAVETLPQAVRSMSDCLIFLKLRRTVAHEDPIGPVALLVPSGAYRQVRRRMLHWLTLDGSASTRMHGGLIPPATSQVSAVKQGPYRKEHGRPMSSWSKSLRPALENEMVLAAIRAMSPASGPPARRAALPSLPPRSTGFLVGSAHSVDAHAAIAVSEATPRILGHFRC